MEYCPWLCGISWSSLSLAYFPVALTDLGSLYLAFASCLETSYTWRFQILCVCRDFHIHVSSSVLKAECQTTHCFCTSDVTGTCHKPKPNCLHSSSMPGHWRHSYPSPGALFFSLPLHRDLSDHQV